MRELLLFAVSIIIHEIGHIIAALILGIPVTSFDIRALGGVFTFDFSRSGYVKESIVHFSGPFFGLLVLCLAYLLYGERAYFFAGVSVSLSLVNLLPIEGFDGGGIIRSILSLFLLPDTVWRICRVASVIGVIALWMAVIWVELRVDGNLGLMVFVVGIMLGQMK